MQTPPDALTQLLEELADEHIVSEVETAREARAVIYLEGNADDEADGIRINAEDCTLLFANESTVERLLEALNSPNASLALFDVTVPADSLEALERGFIAVDEG